MTSDVGHSTLDIGHQASDIYASKLEKQEETVLTICSRSKAQDQVFSVATDKLPAPE